MQAKTTTKPASAPAAPSYQGYAALGVVIREGVAYVTLNNPPLNVLDATLLQELDRFAAAVCTDTEVRVIVFQSANPEFFIAHGDSNFVNDPQTFIELPIGLDQPDWLNPMQRLHERLRQLPQVTIAKIAGFARGGGVELAMALDMRFAAVGPTGLGQPEVLMGIIPGGGGTQYLTRLVGRARALEIILGAELVGAELAERYGWINRALPADQLDAFVDTLARRIAGLLPGVAAAAKTAVLAAHQPLPDALRTENEQLGQLFMAPAAANRMRAALAAGAQTRAGELDLEALLNNLAQPE